MRRFPFLGVLLLLPALALVMLTGCPGTPPKPAPTGKVGGDGDGKEKDGNTEKIKAATDGTVTGVVKFDGTAPTPVSIEDEISKHADKAKCMAGKAVDVYYVSDQKWIIKDGGVGNVVISLEPSKGWEYDVKDDLKAKWAKKAAVLDQPYCAYAPHVIALYADVQPLLIKNSAAFPHNTKIERGALQGGVIDTGALAPASKYDVRSFKYQAKPIPISCSMHSWMNGRIVTFKHPYFAVTDKDGSFEILDVPSGVELRVFMWHESFDAPKEWGKVTAKAGTKTTIEKLTIK